jgi:hypothetical protein
MKKSIELALDKTSAEYTPSWLAMPEDVRIGVERGINQSKKREGKPHTEMKKKYAKWLKK